MVKKISTFLSNTFRKELDRNENFRNSVEVETAFAIPHLVVMGCLTRFWGDDGTSFALGRYREQFLPAFEKAQRIECTLDCEQRFTDNRLPEVTATIRFYERGGRTSCLWMPMMHIFPSGNLTKL
jgi:hypothetical protein